MASWTPSRLDKMLKLVEVQDDANLGCSKINPLPARRWSSQSSTAKFTKATASAHLSGHLTSGGPYLDHRCKLLNRVHGGLRINTCGLSRSTRPRADLLSPGLRKSHFLPVMTQVLVKSKLHPPRSPLLDAASLTRGGENISHTSYIDSPIVDFTTGITGGVSTWLPETSLSSSSSLERGAGLSSSALRCPVEVDPEESVLPF